MDTQRDDASIRSGVNHLSRRSAVRWLGGGGFAAVLAARGLGVGAQDETRTVEAEDVPDVVRDWFDAWNSADPAANLAELYTDDGVHEDVPTDTRSDPGEVEEFVDAFVAQVSDIEVDLRNAFGTDDWAAGEWDFAFDYTGQFAGLPAGTGQRVTVRGATIFELEDGEIRRSSDYYDNTSLLAAVGLLPTPRAETPAAVGGDETPAVGAETPAVTAETPAAETPAAETPVEETPVAETPAADETPDTDMTPTDATPSA